MMGAGKSTVGALLATRLGWPYSDSDAEVETLAARVGKGAGRPLLNPDPVTALSRLYQERRPLYQELADVTIDVDKLSPGEIVERIMAHWEHAHA